MSAPEENAAAVKIQAMVRAKRAAKVYHQRQKQNKHDKLKKMKEAREQRKRENAAAFIQACIRGALQRPKFRIALKRRQEVGGLKDQIELLKAKLANADEEKEEAIKQAEDRATRAMAEMDNDDANDDVEATQMAQQARLAESEKVLSFLESEHLRLQTQMKNHQTRCKRIVESNEELKEATEAAYSRIEEIKQYMDAMHNNKDTLNRNKDVYAKNLKAFRKELKTGHEYLKSEEQLRDVYRNAVEQIVALVQEECKDDALVEDIYIMAMECDDAGDAKNASFHDSTEATASVSENSGI